MLKKREIIIADESGMMSLTLWDNLATDDNISINSVYFIKNVATRLFSNIKTLTATKSITFQHCDDHNAFQDINDETFRSTSEISTAEGEIINITIKKSTNCFSCNKKNMEQTESQFLKCTSCNMKVKTCSLNTSLTSTFQLKVQSGTILKLNAYNATLTNSLITMQKEDLKNDPDELENMMLHQPNSYGLNTTKQTTLFSRSLQYKQNS
jgi:ribosomal protein L37AE/L43A